MKYAPGNNLIAPTRCNKLHTKTLVKDERRVSVYLTKSLSRLPVDLPISRSISLSLFAASYHEAAQDVYSCFYIATQITLVRREEVSTWSYNSNHTSKHF